MSAASEKSDIRTRYRIERRERFVEYSFAQLADLDELASATNIASYVSYGDEPSTKELNSALLQNGKNLFLPRVIGEELEWAQWTGESSEMAPSKLSKKILEPTTASLSDLSQIQVIIVPALRIDRTGIRLGQGGGFFDRALSKLQAWSIALIYPDEISSEDLPREDFDKPVHAAATPDLVIRFNN